MELIADGLLIATGMTAALYCIVLSQRLRRLTDVRSGIGGQIEALNAALEETRSALAETRKGVTEARGSARTAVDSLVREVSAARAVIAELEHAIERKTATPAPGGAATTGRPKAPANASARTERDERAMADVPDAFEAFGDGATGADEIDDIPDWPDGVVQAPDGRGKSPTAPQPLKMQRMAI